MAKKKMQPVSVAGIEFDALIDEQKDMSATIPSYPVEEGFQTSDTIILNPIAFSATLYLTNTPVTWLKRHGASQDRVQKVCDEIENMWMEKKLVKIVTSDAIYTNMGITSISIKKSREIGYAREISIQAQKVTITKTKTTTIPEYVLKSGETQASAGTASTSTSSSISVGSPSGNSSGGSSSNSNSEQSAAKNSKSILYGIAENLEFL